MFLLKWQICGAMGIALLASGVDRPAFAAADAKDGPAAATTTTKGAAAIAGPLSHAAAPLSAAAADTEKSRPLSAAADRRLMLEQLHLPTSEASFPSLADDPKRPANTRPAARGSNYTDDDGSTYVRSSWGNWSNYDESKANPYPLPEVLRLNNGQAVTDAETWWKLRRPEIVEDFDREIYGRVPKETPKVTWEVVKVEDDGKVKTKQLLGHVDNATDPDINVDIQLTLATPSGATGPVPVIMQFSGFGFGRGPGAGGGPPLPGTSPPPRQTGGPPGSNWRQQVLDKGWGWAMLAPNSIQGDNGAQLSQGIVGLCNKGQPRKPDDWGALRAWALGASRALDYFESDKDVDAKQVGLEGHSRYGKAALVTLAYDPRFAIAYVSSSGEGGAKLHRRDWGETVDNMAGTGEYHWMAGNFLKYGGHWDEMPVDSHELIALCAPRPVFISGGATKGDGWVDAKGMFMAAAAAGPVYKLLGKKDLGTTEFPPVGTPLVDGDLAFCQHTQGHTDAPNWPVFLEFAGRYLKGPAH